MRGALAWGLALLLFPLAAANTVMTDSGHPIVFTSQGGNEWWVQVALSAQGAGSVIGVDAMDTGGAWATMTSHPDWGFGVYAASFHIEPGHQVRFRAHWSGGGEQTSCWFTHPQGVEQCPTTTTSSTSTTTSTSSSSTTTTSSGFDATFTHVQGNEWWVQSNVVATGGTLATVDVRLNSGSWQPLPHQSWGGWAASYHIVQGTVVQLRATSSTGALDFSDCYQWIPASGADASQVNCRVPPPPPPPPATAVFYDNVKGNEWWIEAKAHSQSPVAGVDTRVNGGTWVPMTLQNWGSWAVSTHAAAGSHVQFRARFPDGTYAFIPNGYLWTAATQYPPSSSTFDVKFENTDHGNSGWVQVNVYAPSNWGLGAVRARVDGGAWQDLTRQPWGDWAAPIHADNGSYVEFLAFSQGQAPAGAMSGKFVWPSGRPVGAWPVEGSFVTYSLDDGFGNPGCCNGVMTHATLRLTFHAGAWAGTCMGRTQEYDAASPSDPVYVTHDYTWTYDVHEGPPTASTSPILNATTNLHPLSSSEYTQGNSGSCGHSEVITMPVGRTRYATQLKDRDGNALVLPVWWSQHDPSDPTPVDDTDYWEPHLGLMTDWFHSAEDSGGWSGHLTDTDAPIR